MSAQETPNPTGLDGIEFVEFASNDPAKPSTRLFTGVRLLSS
jgi:4-hydroxyphenylpyruvate dioxygenase-like putative hemolysin